MGLFRRGTKLLRLSGGLRDCCCRPEKPEECWCPDWCRYYWDWGGTTIFPAREYLKTSCESGGYDATILSSAPASFGFLSTVFNTQTNLESGLYSPSGVFVSASYFVDGLLAEAANQDIFGLSGVGGYSYYFTRHLLVVYCEQTEDGRARFLFDAQSYIEIVASGQQFHSVERKSLRNNITAQSSCYADAALFCVEPEAGEVVDRLHLAEDIAFSFGELGVAANGTLYAWTEEPFLGSQVVDNRTQTELYKVAGDIDFAATATIKRRNSCQPGDPCDCTASLSGKQVLFEGKTFNYGNLDNFFFPANPGDPYSGTWWEETPVGTFTRRDVENCDGSLNQRVKVVEVDCINEGGVDKWVAYLDHTCNERDDLTCPGPADAQRVKQWTGFFLCDESGSPTGSPTDLEVDYDVTAGTPAAECVAALQPPSFQFL